MRILPITSAEDLEKILPLIRGYQAFYNGESDDDRNRAHFLQLLESSEGGMQLVAWSAAEEPLGFATLYFPFSTVRADRFCLMNDLFVIPSARRLGVGKALIESCIRFAGDLGFPTIEWQTQAENKAAQLLYEKIPGAVSAEWRTYSVVCARN